MATDTSKVYVASGPKVKGIFHRAPSGTTLPTSSTSALSPDYEDQGGTSDAGIVNAQTRNVVKIKDHDGETIATPQDEYSETFTVEVVESLNAVTLRTVFGDDNVTVTPATPSSGTEIKVSHNATILPESVFVVDTIQGKGTRRQIVPKGKVTGVGDVTLASKDIIKYALTIECFKYVDGDEAHYVIEYINDGVVAP